MLKSCIGPVCLRMKQHASVIVFVRYEGDEDVEELPNIKSRLILKIKLGVEEEVSLLMEIL
jgi:hypothetical protein